MSKKVCVDPMSRRMFLRGAGGSLLSIPLLPSLLPRSAWGQANDQTIRRFISATGDYGTGHPMHQLPSLAKLARTLPMSGDHKPVYYAPMSEFVKPAGITRILGAGANALANDITIMRGLDFPMWFSSHGYAHVLGNTKGNVEGGNFPHTETIDQLLKRQTKFNPGGKEVAFFKNVQFIGDDLYSYARNSAGEVRPVSPIAFSPKSLYDRLFNKGNYPESSGGTQAPAKPADPKRAPLAQVMENYKSVRNGRQISSVDRAVLDQYFDLMSSIHNSLDGGAPAQTVGACLHKNISIVNDGEKFSSGETLRSYADIVSAAIMCDITRIVNFAWWIDNGHAGISDFHETVTHGDFLNVVAGVPNHERIADGRAFVFQKFSLRLAQNLSAGIDPSNGKSYLHNSLILTTSEDMIPHAPLGIPVTLIGNAGGNLRSGNYIDYSDWSLGPIKSGFFANFNSNPSDQRFSHLYWGQPYNRLMVTILQAMGLSPADYEDPTLNTGFENITDGRFGAQNNGIAKMGGYGVLGSPTDISIKAYLKNYQLKYFKDPLPMP
ncbi:MAG: DUF1552 domain-containing protein [Bdellovibrionales bacterium]